MLMHQKTNIVKIPILKFIYRFNKTCESFRYQTCVGGTQGSLLGPPRSLLGADLRHLVDGAWPHTLNTLQASRVWAYQYWDCDLASATQGSASDLTPTTPTDSMSWGGGSALEPARPHTKRTDTHTHTRFYFHRAAHHWVNHTEDE